MVALQFSLGLCSKWKSVFAEIAWHLSLFWKFWPAFFSLKIQIGCGCLSNLLFFWQLRFSQTFPWHLIFSLEQAPQNLMTMEKIHIPLKETVASAPILKIASNYGLAKDRAAQSPPVKEELKEPKRLKCVTKAEVPILKLIISKNFSTKKC